MRVRIWLYVLALLYCGVLRAESIWHPLDNSSYEQGITTAIGVHTPSDNIIMTTWNKGIFRSTDDGATWHNVFATDSSLHCVAMRNDGVLFVGGVRGYVFVSRDSGATWSRTKINTLYPVSKIGFTATGRIIAATGVIEDREGYAYDAGDGVFVSDDDGTTWSARNTGITSILCVDKVVLQPSGRVWIATSNWRGEGTQGGLYYSDNNGDSWNFLRIKIDGKGILGDAIDVLGIEAIAFDKTGRILISLRGSDIPTTGANAVACEFIAASSDLTSPWEILSVTESNMFWMQSPLFSLHIAKNGAIWGSTIGGNRRGIFMSDNGGGTWTRSNTGILPALSGRYEPISFAEQNDGTLYAIQWLDNHVYRLATTTDIGEHTAGATTLTIAPNPVSRESVVLVELPTASTVRLTAVDVLGREVAVLAEGAMSAGTHHIAWSGSDIAPGQYFLLLHTSSGTTVQKIIYIAQ